MKVTKVVVSCFKRDVYLLRACVASIRYWYPDIELYLLKDTNPGKFSTTEIEREYHAKIISFPLKYHGWGFTKISCLINFPGRFFLLDSDTILLGPALDSLSQYNEDFIVTGYENSSTTGSLLSHYFNLEKLKAIDPNFVYPGYGINTGQLVATGNIIHEADIDPLVVKHNGILSEKNPGTFPHADQGIINYVLAKKYKEQKATVRYVDFWIWPGVSDTTTIKLDNIKIKQGIPYVLHWAGIKPIDFRKLKRYDLFEFFENEYYRKISFGKAKRLLRRTKLICIAQTKILSYKIRKLNYPK